MSVPPNSPPAGWYPDPQAAGQQRYWDGFNWTQHVAPLQPPATPVPAQQPGYGYQQPHGGYQQPAVSRDMRDEATAGTWVFSIIGTLLIPLIGIILGIVWMNKKGSKKQVGITCLCLAIGEIVLFVLTNPYS